MIELVCVYIQRDIDVTQAVLVADVGERHARQLVPASKLPSAMIDVVFVDDALAFKARKQAQ